MVPADVVLLITGKKLLVIGKNVDNWKKLLIIEKG